MTNLEIATKIENCFNAIHNGFKQLKHDKKQELLKINSKDKTYIFLTKDEEDLIISKCCIDCNCNEFVIKKILNGAIKTNSENKI